jgi:hypothetical protein
MIITRKHLSRRTFLRGASALVGLPFLDAMVPALGWAREGKPQIPTRLCFVYVPKGMVMSSCGTDPRIVGVVSTSSLLQHCSTAPCGRP